MTLAYSSCANGMQLVLELHDVKVKMASMDCSFLCTGSGDTERVKESKGRRKVNAHSSERVLHC